MLIIDIKERVLIGLPIDEYGTEILSEEPERLAAIGDILRERR